jgi:hypothetical protein
MRVRAELTAPAATWSEGVSLAKSPSGWYPTREGIAAAEEDTCHFAVHIGKEVNPNVTA